MRKKFGTWAVGEYAVPLVLPPLAVVVAVAQLVGGDAPAPVVRARAHEGVWGTVTGWGRGVTEAHERQWKATFVT